MKLSHALSLSLLIPVPAMAQVVMPQEHLARINAYRSAAGQAPLQISHLEALEARVGPIAGAVALTDAASAMLLHTRAAQPDLPITRFEAFGALWGWEDVSGDKIRPMIFGDKGNLPVLSAVVGALGDKDLDKPDSLAKVVGALESYYTGAGSRSDASAAPVQPSVSPEHLARINSLRAASHQPPLGREHLEALHRKVGLAAGPLAMTAAAASVLLDRFAGLTDQGDADEILGGWDKISSDHVRRLVNGRRGSMPALSALVSRVVGKPLSAPRDLRRLVATLEGFFASVGPVAPPEPAVAPIPFKLALWAEGLGFETSLLNDPKVRRHVADHDASGALTALARLASAPGHETSRAVLENSRYKIEFIDIVEP